MNILFFVFFAQLTRLNSVPLFSVDVARVALFRKSHQILKNHDLTLLTNHSKDYINNKHCVNQDMTISLKL